jgi:hypothetical protein
MGFGGADVYTNIGEVNNKGIEIYCWKVRLSKAKTLTGVQTVPFI